jgi:hypothetical protein
MLESVRTDTQPPQSRKLGLGVRHDLTYCVFRGETVESRTGARAVLYRVRGVALGVTRPPPVLLAPVVCRGFGCVCVCVCVRACVRGKKGQSEFAGDVPRVRMWIIPY